MALAYVYENHGEALEADLLAFWGQDINEISLRRMRNLFFRLPYNSQVHYEINEVPEDARIWDVNTYMLANVIDAVMAVDWHVIAANSTRAPKPPKPFQRPTLKKVVKEKKTTKNFWPGKTIVDKG